jgi:hypothetical protein
MQRMDQAIWGIMQFKLICGLRTFATDAARSSACA